MRTKTPFSYPMTNKAARQYAKVLRDLVKTRDLTPAQEFVLNRMFFELRQPGADRCTAALETIRRVTRRAISTISAAISRAVGLGLLQRIKRKDYRAIGTEVRLVNVATTYVFVPIPAEIVAPSANNETILEVSQLSFAMRLIHKPKPPKPTPDENLAGLRQTNPVLAAVFDAIFARQEWTSRWQK